MPPIDAEIATGFESLLATLPRVGARVEQVPVQAFVDLQGYYRLYLSLKSALMSMDRPRDERQQLAAALRAAEPNKFTAAIAAGLVADAAHYIQWFGQYDNEGHQPHKLPHCHVVMLKHSYRRGRRAYARLCLIRRRRRRQRRH